MLSAKRTKQTCCFIFAAINDYEFIFDSYSLTGKPIKLQATNNQHNKLNTLSSMHNIFVEYGTSKHPIVVFRFLVKYYGLTKSIKNNFSKRCVMQHVNEAKILKICPAYTCYKTKQLLNLLTIENTCSRFKFLCSLLLCWIF